MIEWKNFSTREPTKFSMCFEIHVSPQEREPVDNTKNKTKWRESTKSPNTDQKTINHLCETHQWKKSTSDRAACWWTIVDVSERISGSAVFRWRAVREFEKKRSEMNEKNKRHIESKHPCAPTDFASSRERGGRSTSKSPRLHRLLSIRATRRPLGSDVSGRFASVLGVAKTRGKARLDRER